MDQKKLEERLSEYNSIIKENDELYRAVAKTFGLPDCAFWILYALRENGRTLTQSEICNMMYQPKQTVNSSLKKLEGDGYIQLAGMRDRRSKEVRLTEKGTSLAKETVDHVISAELKALSGLTEEEQHTFISLFQKYTVSLKYHLHNLDKSAGDSTVWNPLEEKK